MKIGLILECTPSGADLQVYSHFAQQLLGADVEIEASCAGNKKILVREAGKRTKALFTGGCERVLIIWDLWPRWDKDEPKPWLANDVGAITHTLQEAHVNNPCVFLIGVDRMLETLLIVDGGAIAKVLNVPKRRQWPKHQHKPRNIPKPKIYLDRLFQRYHRGPYADYRHAKQIAENIDVTRLESACPEFVQFRQSLSQVPCRPPLAWNP